MTHTHIIKNVLPGSIAEELGFPQGISFLQSMIKRLKMSLIIIFLQTRNILQFLLRSRMEKRGN